MDDTKRILIVEDEPTLLDILAAELSKAGFSVCKSSDAASAFQAAKDNEPNIILLDILLPNGDGGILLEKFKADEKTKNIPVVVLTNLTDEDTRKKCETAGCVDFLVKADYRIGELVQKIKEICGRLPISSSPEKK